MEIKQETSEKSCKIEIGYETCVGPLNAVKIEIKEEPKKESAYDTFDYLDFPVDSKPKVGQDEFNLFEEKTNIK
ncbi:unnamed protein product [Diabrotica balteata]|uniref:Uncharacterized protein n=1 Tax=Diabrotica balteata TaxID=107213 RepID=A0A9N9XCG5_DIABA|nr:unnamed protein product [Diabrotica balteata]